MRLRFLKDFDFNPSAMGGRVTVAYKDGQEVVVTRECADAALKAKAAEVMPERKKAAAVE